MNRWVQVAFALVAVLLLSLTIYRRASDCRASNPAGDSDPLDPKVVDFAVPNVTLPAIDGRSINLSEKHSRPVLLNFWATWCSPCIAEMPQLLSLARTLQNRGQIMLVSVDESFDTVRNLADEMARAEAEHPGAELANVSRMLQGKEPNVLILLDAGEKVARQFGTYKYPESFWIDASGKVRIRFIGPKPWGRPSVMEYLVHEGLLSGS